jgi:hypothetical protein
MMRAEPEELTEDVVPVLEAEMSEADLRRLIPVDLTEVDPLSEAEPSLGALVKFEPANRTDLIAVVVYGLETCTLSLRLPRHVVSPESLRFLLEEIPIPENAVVWTNPLARDDRHSSLPAQA